METPLFVIFHHTYIYIYIYIIYLNSYQSLSTKNKSYSFHQENLSKPIPYNQSPGIPCPRHCPGALRAPEAIGRGVEGLAAPVAREAGHLAETDPPGPKPWLINCGGTPK